MDALGDPTRRAIFERLREGPRAVGELAATLPVSRPAVSQHLRVLKEAGLVVDRAAGHEAALPARARRAWRRCAPTSSTFWDVALAEFKAVAEATYEEER